jgi:hypothetical protein
MPILEALKREAAREGLDLRRARAPPRRAAGPFTAL